ncbi:hypothetical protein OIDMADRAFT_138353 [Oidiodendron maius Zn]|uniref:Ubiquitin-like protease family profile domain-containing protein n=1 Tax=Oidiodendron maius (strain Zn) TaxID=913774 RepID=A0A0C3CTY1_OIDMZ|nr:hypothetical protein OIDMADRAFT_138353 [Oidiodendron maius Zn]
MTLPERYPSSPSRTEQQEASLSNPASIQAQQVNGEQPLPTQDSQTTPSFYPPREALTLTDMVAKAVHIIYEMSKRQEAPTEIHSTILNTLRPNLGGTSTPAVVAEQPGSMWTTSSSTAWSASMWIKMLEAGHARSKETIILNMIEWMGASEWFDAEIEQAKKSPGNLASKDNEDCPSSPTSTGIQRKIFDTRRKKLNNIFYRGRTLRKLVQMTHLGILFDPDIWTYAKASKENIDKVVALFEVDRQKMELLSILDKQVELLVNEGRPDLSRFFDSLESHSITPSEEVSSLRAEYGLERVSRYPGSLDSTVDGVVKGIGHVLGKPTLDDDDSIIGNGSVELSCGIFDRLRSREWLNCWDIAAALEMTDRPAFVRLNLSIPLYKKDTNSKALPLSNPFHRWRKKIDDFRRKGKSDLEDLQVYICPLNVNRNHFTLLEINEQTKMINHYDSMASAGIIQRKTKTTLVRRVVMEEFRDLGFGYTEAPTPQQRDEWSCGLMVIRNAKQLMMGLPVGSWDDEVDPDRVIMEVVGDCQTLLEQHALQPHPISKKRKEMDEVLVPSRSSKRLNRTITCSG